MNRLRQRLAANSLADSREFTWSARARKIAGIVASRLAVCTDRPQSLELEAVPHLARAVGALGDPSDPQAFLGTSSNSRRRFNSQQRRGPAAGK